ncbi:MAG: hypothetical protein UEK58_04780, partial [Merdibacter sp.]|nr:hypothetical protein [Merdibacter sp.]
SIGYSFSLIKTEYKQNKIYQNKKKTKRTVNLSFQSALCQQSGSRIAAVFFLKIISYKNRKYFQKVIDNFHK